MKFAVVALILLNYFSSAAYPCTPSNIERLQGVPGAPYVATQCHRYMLLPNIYNSTGVIIIVLILLETHH